MSVAEAGAGRIALPVAYDRPMPPFRPRRALGRLIFVTAIVAFGAACTIAIAWGLALASSVSTAPREVIHAPDWSRPVPDRWSKPQLAMQSRGHGWHLLVQAGGASAADDYREVSIETRRYGWPLPALARETWSEFGITGAGALGPVTRDHPSSAYLRGWAISAEATLPLRPLVPGFAVNTMVYAALAAAAWWSSGVIRRVRRQRCGACLACGYARDGLPASAPCPECGARPV
jgi:hypothetical protein